MTKQQREPPKLCKYCGQPLINPVCHICGYESAWIPNTKAKPNRKRKKKRGERHWI